MRCSRDQRVGVTLRLGWVDGSVRVVTARLDGPSVWGRTVGAAWNVCGMVELRGTLTMTRRVVSAVRWPLVSPVARTKCT